MTLDWTDVRAALVAESVREVFGPDMGEFVGELLRDADPGKRWTVAELATAWRSYSARAAESV